MSQSAYFVHVCVCVYEYLCNCVYMYVSICVCGIYMFITTVWL